MHQAHGVVEEGIVVVLASVTCAVIPHAVALIFRGGQEAVLVLCGGLCLPELDRGGDLFGQWLAQLFFGAAFTLAFWMGSGTIVTTLTSSEMTWEEPGWVDFYGARFQLALWGAIAFFTVARFLSYVDHRTRKEGWEIELRLKDAGRALEEVRAW